MKLTDDQIKKLGLTEAQIKNIREEERDIELLQLQQCDALLDAGWHFEIPKEYMETWQWAWRRPPRRPGKGMRFASTNQAYQHLRKLKPELPEIHQ